MSSTAIIQNEHFNDDHRTSFLRTHGWTIEKPIGQDSSIRRYFRVNKADKSAILMETLPDGSPHATPGHGLGDFVRIAEWLNAIDLKAPEIYESDLKNGYLLLEDLGDTCIKEALKNGSDPRETYEAAANILKHLQQQDCPLDLPNYYESHVHKRHRRVIDWFVPLVRQQANEDGMITQYKSIWAEIESGLPPCPQGFVHIDYHAENLMWLPDQTPLKRCGILDFQGAMHGPIPYDLANLLEDARGGAPQDLRQSILSNYDEDFQAWYRVLATQFHCRVIGQFIKMAVMDDNPSYLPHIPRLQKYLHQGLQSPTLQPLAKFFKELDVDFTIAQSLENLPALRDLVRQDAL